MQPYPLHNEGSPFIIGSRQVAQAHGRTASGERTQHA